MVTTYPPLQASRYAIRACYYDKRYVQSATDLFFEFSEFRIERRMAVLWTKKDNAKEIDICFG